MEELHRHDEHGQQAAEVACSRPNRLDHTLLCFSHLYIKVIFSPRQARDKHRENSKKGLSSACLGKISRITF
jgi:hypothetical protein